VKNLTKPVEFGINHTVPSEHCLLMTVGTMTFPRIKVAKCLRGESTYGSIFDRKTLLREAAIRKASTDRNYPKLGNYT
jgi:hypothetical protein